MTDTRPAERPDPIQLGKSWLAWRCPIDDCTWRFHATSRKNADAMPAAFARHWAETHDEARPRSLFET